MEIMESLQALSRATSKESTKEHEEKGKSYRFSPEDGVLEREVLVTKVLIWVPVLPGVPVPDELLTEASRSVTWRRYAFDRAHSTFLEPHRNSSATWQALTRMGFWRKQYFQFTTWIRRDGTNEEHSSIYRRTG